MKNIKIVLALAILNLIALICITYGLPNMVPMHINSSGTVSYFGSKWFIPIFGLIPVILTSFYILYIGKLQSDLNKKIEDKIYPVIAIIFIPITWILAILALKYQENIHYFNSTSNFVPIDIVVFVLVLIAIIFIVISHYVRDLKQNWYAGIRTPWTLKNEVVWKKTHKLGFYTFRISGLLLLVFSLAAFLTKDIIYVILGLIIAIIIAAVIPIVYSYYEYNKIKNH